eukprot:UN10376
MGGSHFTGNVNNGMDTLIDIKINSTSLTLATPGNIDINIRRVNIAPGDVLLIRFAPDYTVANQTIDVFKTYTEKISCFIFITNK